MQPEDADRTAAPMVHCLTNQIWSFMDVTESKKRQPTTHNRVAKTSQRTVQPASGHLGQSLASPSHSPAVSSEATDFPELDMAMSPIQGPTRSELAPKGGYSAPEGDPMSFVSYDTYDRSAIERPYSALPNLNKTQGSGSMSQSRASMGRSSTSRPATAPGRSKASTRPIGRSDRKVRPQVVRLASRLMTSTTSSQAGSVMDSTLDRTMDASSVSGSLKRMNMSFSSQSAFNSSVLTHELNSGSFTDYFEMLKALELAKFPEFSVERRKGQVALACSALHYLANCNVTMQESRGPSHNDDDSQGSDEGDDLMDLLGREESFLGSTSNRGGEDVSRILKMITSILTDTLYLNVDLSEVKRLPRVSMAAAVKAKLGGPSSKALYPQIQALYSKYLHLTPSLYVSSAQMNYESQLEGRQEKVTSTVSNAFGGRTKRTARATFQSRLKLLDLATTKAIFYHWRNTARFNTTRIREKVRSMEQKERRRLKSTYFYRFRSEVAKLKIERAQATGYTADHTSQRLRDRLVEAHSKIGFLEHRLREDKTKFNRVAEEREDLAKRLIDQHLNPLAIDFNRDICDENGVPLDMGVLYFWRPKGIEDPGDDPRAKPQPRKGYVIRIRRFSNGPSPKAAQSFQSASFFLRLWASNLLQATAERYDKSINDSKTPTSGRNSKALKSPAQAFGPKPLVSATFLMAVTKAKERTREEIKKRPPTLKVDRERGWYSIGAADPHKGNLFLASLSELKDNDLLIALLSIAFPSQCQELLGEFAEAQVWDTIRPDTRLGKTMDMVRGLGLAEGLNIANLKEGDEMQMQALVAKIFVGYALANLPLVKANARKTTNVFLGSSGSSDAGTSEAILAWVKAEVELIKPRKNKRDAYFAIIDWSPESMDGLHVPMLVCKSLTRFFSPSVDTRSCPSPSEPALDLATYCACVADLLGCHRSITVEELAGCTDKANFLFLSSLYHRMHVKTEPVDKSVLEPSMQSIGRTPTVELIPTDCHSGSDKNASVSEMDPTSMDSSTSAPSIPISSVDPVQTIYPNLLVCNAATIGSLLKLPEGNRMLERERKAINGVLQEHKVMLRNVFGYYAAQGVLSPFIGFQELVELCKDIQVLTRDQRSRFSVSDLLSICEDIIRENPPLHYRKKSHVSEAKAAKEKDLLTVDPSSSTMQQSPRGSEEGADKGNPPPQEKGKSKSAKKKVLAPAGFWDLPPADFTDFLLRVSLKIFQQKNRGVQPKLAECLQEFLTTSLCLAKISTFGQWRQLLTGDFSDYDADLRKIFLHYSTGAVEKNEARRESRDATTNLTLKQFQVMASDAGLLADSHKAPSSPRSSVSSSHSPTDDLNDPQLIRPSSCSSVFYTVKQLHDGIFTPSAWPATRKGVDMAAVDYQEFVACLVGLSCFRYPHPWIPTRLKMERIAHKLMALKLESSLKKSPRV